MPGLLIVSEKFEMLRRESNVIELDRLCLSRGGSLLLRVCDVETTQF